MAERTFNGVQYKLRGDLLANWLSKNPVLADREPAVVIIPADTNSGLNEPAVLLKIGDGTTAFDKLSYVSALAGDVPAWAKAPSKPSYEAKEITGIDAYIANYVNEQMGISVDTDTQYQVVKVDDYNYKLQSKGKTDEAWSDVSTIVIPKYDDTALAERATKLETAVGKDENGALKPVATQISDAISAQGFKALAKKDQVSKADLDEALATELNGKLASDDFNAFKTTNTDAINTAKQAGDDALAEAQKRVASVAAGDASVTVAGTATAPTVAVKLDPAADNAIKLGENGLKVEIGAAPEYTIEKAAESGEYAAVYTLMKDGVQAGASINIPKDMVVESGAVVENPEGQAAGTYIELKLQNVEQPLYINVGNLIEYVTSGSQTGDMVVITVSDDHKVTATITDGTITLAKLSTEVQTAIGKAHTHENASVLAGIDATKVENWNEAYTKAHTHAEGALDITAADMAAKLDKSLYDAFIVDVNKETIADAKKAGTDAQAAIGMKDGALYPVSTQIADQLSLFKTESVDPVAVRVKALEDAGATKVEASETNGNIKINGTETTVYTLPETVLTTADTFIFDGGNA